MVLYYVLNGASHYAVASYARAKGDDRSPPIASSTATSSRDSPRAEERDARGRCAGSLVAPVVALIALVLAPILFVVALVLAAFFLAIVLVAPAATLTTTTWYLWIPVSHY
jgi:hypothetical protein